MFHYLIGTSFAWDLFHPLRGDGYQFWSGIAGSFLTSLPGWGTALVIYTRHRNCHHKTCWRIRTHNHPDHGWPACKKHWDEVPDHIADRVR